MLSKNCFFGGEARAPLSGKGSGERLNAQLRGSHRLTNLLVQVVFEINRRLSRRRFTRLIVEHQIPGVTPEMVDWWWDNINTTERYKLWHPKDHIAFEWEITPGETSNGHVGALSINWERIGRFACRLPIRWDPISTSPIPTEYGHVLVASVLGIKNCVVGRLVHEYEESSTGTRMRSTFLLPATTSKRLLDCLRKHNQREMQELQRFLPKLYASEAQV
jgi:hypothetical protein